MHLLLRPWDVPSPLGLGSEVHSAGCTVAGVSSLGGARWGAACTGGVWRGVAGVGVEGRVGPVELSRQSALRMLLACHCGNGAIRCLNTAASAARSRLS